MYQPIFLLLLDEKGPGVIPHDSTIVDGRKTMHGTGSEDYFNGRRYAMMDRWDSAYSLPLSGSLDYNLPLVRTADIPLWLTITAMAPQ